MEFKVFTDWKQLAPFTESFFKKSESLGLFTSKQWLELLLAYTQTEENRFYFVCVIDEQNLLALLPLCGQNFQQLRSINHRYTALNGILLSSSKPEKVCNLLANGLHQHGCQSLQLEPVDINNHLLLLLTNSMTTKGYASQSHFRFYNWTHLTSESNYQDYLSNRPSKLKNTLARKQRKMERELTYRYQIYRGIEVKQAMNDYHQTYASSWKAHEQYTDLLNDLAETFAKQDWTRLAVLYINDQPAAAQLWFVINDNASIFRLAYDEQWKPYSPGTLLTAFLMEYVIDQDQVKEIDFLVGNESYKQDWMSQRNERYSLLFSQTKPVKKTD